MASPPNAFSYGSVSSTNSMMDAIASYRRAQYYPSSNVQSSNLLEDGVEDSNLESTLSESDGISQQHSSYSAQREGENVLFVMDQENSAGPSAWTIPAARFGRTDKDKIRAIPSHTNLVETCPLLNESPSTTNYTQGHPDAPGLVSSKSGQFTTEELLLGRSTSSIHQTNAQGAHGGQSTYGQTLFNCIAVLLGIVFGYVTCYTAKFLAHEMSEDLRLRSYADISRKAFGPKSSVLTNTFFLLEVFSLSVALVTLSADSLHSVWPAYSADTYKVSFLSMLVPMAFVPLSALSYTSLLGIFSTLLVAVAILIDGFSKPDSPGSLWNPAPTSFTPGSLGHVGIAFGLFMAGLSGHVVIPSLARDMVDPSQFDRMANCAFTVTTITYTIIGFIGYLMFGSSVSDEISRNLLETPGYNPTLNKLAMWLLVVTPLSKFALSTRPLNIILEGIFGLDPSSGLVERGNGKSISPTTRIRPSRKLFIAIERILVPIMSVTVSILVPQFSTLMAFLGSFSAFVICVIGPILAKIAMKGECCRFDGIVLAVSSVLAIWGTVSAFWIA
ncbi:transmembrane amino acid transporter protein-domain-containing protein [Pisolithus croceorrhizus]|nr:transmembrane amino acid transporter protein-domain-containing protein [Pisolithus croceorrhizus]